VYSRARRTGTAIALAKLRCSDTSDTTELPQFIEELGIHLRITRTHSSSFITHNIFKYFNDTTAHLHFMTKFVSLLLCCASIVFACGDNAYRCKNSDVSTGEMWKVTKDICDDLKEETCYCFHWAEYYCEPQGDNIQKFKDACENRAEN